MNRIRTNLIQYIFTLIVSVVALMVPQMAEALPAAAYAEASRLATGRWVKVSVDADGLYMIPASTLRSWGFTDISRVRVYGYGGRRLPDLLSIKTYIDDLPQIQSVTTDAGIVFYGIGTAEWTETSLGQSYLRQNDFSTAGHYFIGELSDGEEPRSFRQSGVPGAVRPATTVSERLHYEVDKVPVPGVAGPELLGEDMRYTRSRTFSFTAPDAVPDATVGVLCSFVSDCSSGALLSFTLNGSTLETTANDRVSAPAASSYVHGVETLTRHAAKASVNPQGAYTVGITFTPYGNCNGAWLNYLSLTYTRNLKIPASGHLCFTTEESCLSVDGVAPGGHVWEVTDPADIRVYDVEYKDGKAIWSTLDGERSYAVWNPSASLPAPKYLGVVANQNLHADRDYDMVIVSPALFVEQAKRLAALHESSVDKLRVKVVSPEDIYNEFSSGTTDVGAIRRYFKMLYDRGLADGGERRLRYAVMFGRTTLDNRGLSASAPDFPTVPMWMARGARQSLSDNESYCTDDVTAMLEDDSGENVGVDKLSIAIGRIPALSAAEAKDIVDKAYQYAEGAKKTAWKHRYMFLADDEDNGIHLRQTESLISQFENADRQQHLVRKVYMDAYEFVGGVYPEARATMYRYLDEGVVWWNFIGHANTTGWTGEGQLSYTDLNNMYLRHWPFIYAATCNFLRIDGLDISGGEIMYKERYGGVIGMISATRPVYISDNGYLSNAIGRALARRTDDGLLLPPGEIYRLAKNDIRSADGKLVSNTNRLRYVFIGDPALRLAMPSNIVRIDKIGNEVVDGNGQPTLPALGQVPVEGSVTDPDGNILSGFTGVVLIDIFDAERTVTTYGRGDSGSVENFEDYGDRIFCGSAEVKDGRFSINVAMPSELSQNFRPATMSLYAYSTADDTEAVGLNRQFYCYGYDEQAPVDEKAPEIEQMVLNHSSFRSGDKVNASPMLIAAIRDDVGINISTAGVGHQMVATLDGTQTFSDVSYYFTPASDGSPSGVINYPFDGLQPGNHTLTLKVWDTSNNSSTATIDFFVQESLAPKIFDVYSDANPASTQANFYLKHDQPDNMVTVTVSVYNMLGRPVWTGSSTGRSDMFTTIPVSWDLNDTGGRRVSRGIYLYRATVTADGVSHQTATRRIAVTAK